MMFMRCNQKEDEENGGKLARMDGGKKEGKNSL
jgi:hypothetical protein